MRDLKNFDLSTQKSQKYVFLKSYFRTKYILFFELNKYRGVFFHDTKE